MYTYRHQVAVDAHRRDETREGGIGLSDFGRSTHAQHTHTFFTASADEPSKYQYNTHTGSLTTARWARA